VSNLRLALGLASLTILAALVGVILWQRGDLEKAKAERDQWKETSQTWERANADNVRAIAGLRKARDDNDALAKDLQAKLNANASREVETRTVIREIIRNDPVARSWADSPVPDSLRNAAQAGDRN
jgi:hypothetical protein